MGINLFGLGIKKKVNDTEYGIGFFPLGGYVKVAGIIDESLDPDHSDEMKDYEFRSKNTFQKLWFLSAGVIMNFILTIFIYFFSIYFNGIDEPIREPIINNSIENIIAKVHCRLHIRPKGTTIHAQPIHSDQRST